jgi:photosystem II stability/assembly factor-like uncharacterized protein
MPPGLVDTEIAFADDARGLLLNTGTVTPDCATQTVSLGETRDGAATWQVVAATGIANAMCKRGLASVDSTHDLFTASSQNNAPLIYRTADAGKTWQASAALPDPPGFTTQGAGIVIIPGRPKAFGSVVLVAAADGRQQNRYVYRSTDGGATWTYASTIPGFDGGIAFVTQSRWLLLIGPGQSKETTDSGASWHASSSDYSQAAPTAPEIVFGDANVGYATVRGEIQRTTDGGAHWTKITTPGTV